MYVFFSVTVFIFCYRIIWCNISFCCCDTFHLWCPLEAFSVLIEKTVSSTLNSHFMYSSDTIIYNGGKSGSESTRVTGNVGLRRLRLYFVQNLTRSSDITVHDKVPCACWLRTRNISVISIVILQRKIGWMLKNERKYVLWEGLRSNKNIRTYICIDIICIDISPSNWCKYTTKRNYSEPSHLR